jgi:hypothetical protein
MKQEADTGFISEEKRGRIEIGLESELQGVKSGVLSFTSPKICYFV